MSQTTSTQTVQFLDTGTKLIFRPFIGDDGYVRLEVHPEDSSGAVTNGLPDSTSTEVTSNIMVKDGRTVVIGGLFREQTTADRGQVPVSAISRSSAFPSATPPTTPSAPRPLFCSRLTSSMMIPLIR